MRGLTEREYVELECYEGGAADGTLLMPDEGDEDSAAADALYAAHRIGDSWNPIDGEYVAITRLGRLALQLYRAGIK